VIGGITMAGTKLESVGSLKKGSYVVLDDEACIVKNTQVSRPGKHGHAKVRLEAVGMLDGKKRQIVMPGHDNVKVPIVEKLNAQVLSVSGKTANVMDLETYQTFDLKIPDEFIKDVKPNSTVLFWDILGQRVMKQVKSD